MTNKKTGAAEKSIKNPLRKRIIRDIVGEKSKYLSIFLFLTLTIGFISGMMISCDSMKQSQKEAFEKYNIEDGHFELMNQADISVLEKPALYDGPSYTLYESFFYDYTANNLISGQDEAKELSIRIYQNRTDINTASVFEGHLPETENEIAIDRLFADNNSIRVGDTLHIDGKAYTISALIALPDYNSLFKSNSDLMFDAQTFTIAVVSEDAFLSLPQAQLKYNYSYIFDEKALSDTELHAYGTDIVTALTADGHIVNSYVATPDNQAIQFTINDIGGDQTMCLVALYIIIVIFAFIFTIMTGNDIENEASAIGTLRASGYTKAELVRHYLTAPFSVALIASVAGNILGYTCLKTVCADLYYASYSLPVYETRWNVKAFVLTTIIPMVLLLIINIVSISRKLSLSPLRFLRRDISRRRRKRVTRLPNFRFFTRFRLRVLLQNLPNFIIMAIGIFLANLLFIFCNMFGPILDDYKNKVLDNMIAEYQYILKAPYELGDASEAEKYAATSLLLDDVEISVYGISENSSYLTKPSMPDSEGTVVVSESFLKKNKLEIGDSFTLSEKYTDNTYTFKIADAFNYPAAISVFMTLENYNAAFGLPEDSYTGYFSNQRLEELDENYIYKIITADDLTILTRQLKSSMGSIFPAMQIFAVVLFLIVIFILSKIILEKNAQSISLTKILGYSSGEIGRIYIVSTAIAVLISVTISLPVCRMIIPVFQSYINDFINGWIDLYISKGTYVKTFAVSLLSYGILSLLHLHKISKIPMEQALKNVE